MIRRWIHGASYYRRQLRVGLWKLEGNETHSRQALCVLYAGLERHKNYFSKLAFGGQAREESLGSVWVWDLARALKQDQGQALDVLELNHVREKFYRGRGLRIPVWVWTECDLTGGPASFESSRRFRTHRQRVRQHEVTYRVWSEEAALKDFFENMYLPYANFRHADTAFLYGYPELRAKFASGQLCGLEKNGVPIASQLVVFQGKSAHSFCLGVRRGEEEYLRKGILEVLNYLTLIQLAELGFRTLDLGYSRGFLEDGVLRNKMRLGARVSGRIHEESGYLLYKVRRMTDGLHGFMTHNPMALLGSDGKLYAGYFKGSASNGAPGDSQKQAEDLREDGFEGLKLIRYGDSGDLEIQ